MVCLDSVVGIVNCYVLEGPGIEARWGARFSVHVRTGPGAHSASCTVGTGGKAAASTSPPALPWAFMAYARVNFTF